MPETSRKFVIDFGLNLEAGVERIGFPLSAGLVHVTDNKTGEGDPYWFSRLGAGDSIAYRVWNQTLSTVASARVVCFRATWVNPERFSQLASPLENEEANPTVFAGRDIRTVDPDETRSSVYAQNRGGWIFGDPDTCEAPLGATFRFAEAHASAGMYYLRARLDVVIDERTMRTYHWDPEIIVGAGGGEPPQDPPDDPSEP